MNELIDGIEKSVSLLMRYDLDGFVSYTQDLVNAFVAVLPGIINSYNAPQMTDVRDDALYWPGQLERIIKVLEKGDWFEVIDALYNETRPNLIELREMLTQRGLL